MTRAKDISKIVTDADLSGTLDVTGDLTVDTSTLKVDSTNNRVGIGTSSPSEKLEINSGTGNIGAKIVSTDSLAVIAFKDNSTTDVQYLGANGDNLVFHAGTSPSERMRIDSSGNVGIGTTSPTPQNGKVLHIHNPSGATDLRLTNNTTGTALGNGTILTLSSSTAYLYNYENADFVFGTNNLERIRIKSGGNVGIGTSSPSQLLEINGASNPAVLIKDTTNNCITYMYSQDSVATMGSASAHPVVFNVHNGEKMRIDTSGNVGIGTSSPATKLAVSGSIAGTAGLNISGGGWGVQPYVANSLLIDNNSGQTRLFATGANATTDGSFLFYTSQTDGGANERMRVTSAGDLLVSTTSTSPHVDGSGIAIRSTDGVLIGVNSTHAIIAARHGSDGEVIRIQNGTSDVGSIDVSGSSTSYNTSSDHRLKENVSYDFDATTRLKQLRPARFNFIADADTTVDGFLAHEVQSVVPEAITGTHNEVDADGNPVYQGIDQSKLVPLLVKTIQELEARIVALETA